MSDKLHTTIIKRINNRRLVIVYDSLLYVGCFALVLALGHSLNLPALLISLLGYVLFIGIGWFFDVYKMVLRAGTVHVFARLILSDTIATVSLALINYIVQVFWSGREVPFPVLISSAGVFIVSSIAIRVAYCYIYRFALGKSPMANRIRRFLEIFAVVSFDSNVSAKNVRFMWESQQNVPICINELQWIADKFAIHGKICAITSMDSGYINRTYRVETQTPENGHIHKYTLQKINTNVFRQPDVLMRNYQLVTETLHDKLRISEYQTKPAVQILRQTKDGQPYLHDGSGCWRLMTYFDDVYSMDIPNSTETFEQAGYAFGNFIKAMADMDISSIKEVIPNFHNTKSRYDDLEKSIALHQDGRVQEVLSEIAFVRARSDRFGLIADALAAGEIPTRICHNDCNLNNILFDVTTDRPVAIIDLDTVMPSSPLYDFGDSMRIGTNTAKDDEKDLSKVSCDLRMYESYARGYLRACGSILTERELELLPYAALIITSEDGIRFLMDHIDGDVYYKISYPGQNLDRARTQLKLVEDMERKLPQIKRILRKLYAEFDLQAHIE